MLCYTHILVIYKVANHQPAPFNVSTDSCNCRKFLFHIPLFFFLLSIGFFASFGMSHTLLKRTMPSILFSEHSICILRSEIFHFVAASCTVIYSNITDLHIISRYIILGQTNKIKKRIVTSTIQKNNGRDFSPPTLAYAQIISALMISLALACISFILPTHNIGFSALSCSVTPSLLAICSTNRNIISVACSSISAR